MTPYNWGRFALTVWLTGLVYLLLFVCNEHVLSFTRFADGVNWIYLPSGLRLTLVLVFGVPGALGIAWASTLLSAWPLGLDVLAPSLMTGLISGGAPFLALLACRRWLNVRADLSGLQARTLLAMAVIFAVISAALHQVWYGWNDPSSDRALQFAVMALGDLLGTLVLLYVGYWVLKRVKLGR